MKLLFLLTLIFSFNLHAQKITTNWMERFYKDHPDTKLRNIIIPGTHDSATYLINKKSPFPKESSKFFKLAKKTVANMSKTQNRDIYWQLLRGNRYLDLRVTDYKDKLHIVHGMISVDLETVLKDIRKFAREYPKEVLFIDFQKMPKKEYFPRLNELIQKYLGEYIYFRNISPDRLTFNHFWRRERSIISIINNADFVENYYGHYNRSDFLKSDWANTTVRSTLKIKLKQFFKDQEADKFHVGYFTLTPNTKFIVKGIFAKRRYNIYKLNEKIFTYPGKWLPGWRDQGVKMNIIAVDFEGESNLLGTVLRLNKEALVIKPNAK